MELVPCKVEERNPEVVWCESYRISRLKGLSPATKSFLFRLIHTLLPSKERIHHLTREASPLCWGQSGEQETYQHLFYNCEKNTDAGQALLRCVQSYDHNLTETRSLRLQISADEPFLIASVSILATGLELIWETRKSKKQTSLFNMRSELEMSISIRRKSSSIALREVANIMNNMIVNFHQ